MKSRIRWGRVVAAAFLSELGVFAALLSVWAVYSLLIAPGQTSAEYEAFTDRAAYYVAPAAAALTVFFGALWVGRKLNSDFVLNGALVGIAAVVLSIGFVFIAEPEERLMYMVSYGLRILGGYVGGLVAQVRAAGGRQEVEQKTV